MTTTDPVLTERDCEAARKFQNIVFEQTGVWISDEALDVLCAEIEAAVIADLVQRSGVSAYDVWINAHTAYIETDPREQNIDKAATAIINEALAAAEQRGYERGLLRGQAIERRRNDNRYRVRSAPIGEIDRGE